MSKHKWFYIVILLAMLLAACKPAQTTTEPTAVVVTKVPTPVPAPTATPKPKVATFIFTQEFDTMNPLYTNMWFSGITQQIWNCWAWDFDEVTNPHAVMVKEIPSIENGGVSADGKVITLKLRDDIKWSDGQPITAEDFIFTYQMYIDPKNSVATTHPYELIEKIEAPDPLTLVTTFKDPFASWLYSMWRGVLPKHILQPVYEKDGTINNAEWNRAPTVSCGPYTFDKWESGSYALFKANPNYWLGKPKIDQIFIRFVPDDASQTAALKAGEGELGTFPSMSDIPTFQQAGIEVISVFSGYNEGIYFNLDSKLGNPALQDVRVRQAIAYAIDRFTFNKNQLLGLTVPAATDYDNTPYMDPSLKPYAFDPEKAKQLLDEAGWVDSNSDGSRDKDGVEIVLKFGTTTREIRQDMQAVIQQQLGAVGIKVELTNYAKDLFFSGFDQGGPAALGELDMWEYSASPAAPPDPDVAEWLCDQIPSAEQPSGTNWSRICDPELDQLWKDQISQIDFKQRQQTFYKITKMIFDKAYWIGLWQDPDQFLVSKKLTNVKISGAGCPFFNIIEWDLVP
jgi:peptide/nickel transport system substrate-binding protein